MTTGGQDLTQRVIVKIATPIENLAESPRDTSQDRCSPIGETSFRGKVEYTLNLTFSYYIAKTLNSS